jgi:NDP-sugar pyrophosphorylase family protein
MIMDAARGVVLPSGRSDAFRPLTYQLPLGLLPIVNKPLMEHQVELLVRNNIRHIRISANHLSNRVEGYFNSGQRWGASISYNFERPPFGAVPALRQILPYVGSDSLVILESDVVADVNLEAALRFHRANHADATFFCSRNLSITSGMTVVLNDANRIVSVGGYRHSEATRSYIDGGVCIIEPDILSLLSDNYGYNLVQACWVASQKASLKMFGYPTEEPLARVTDWRTYSRLQGEILNGAFAGILIPGLEIRKGVWVGKNVSASDSASLVAPVILGDNARIGRDARVGSGSVIGHDVMVDSGASVEGSVVLAKTFVGPQAAIKDAIVLGNLMIDAQTNAFTAIADSLTVAEIEQRRVGFKLYALSNRLIALGLLVVLAPLIVLLFVILAMGIKFPLISRVRRIGVDLGELAAGKLRLRVFDLLYFGPIEHEALQRGYDPDPGTILPTPLARVGNIINIIRGDLLFVGNRPMEPEYAFSITEEWKRTRFKCQSGLLSVLDTEEAAGLGEDEQIIAEGYYAINQTPGRDVVLAAKTMVGFVKRLVGLSRKPRQAGFTPAA